jgi:hypothetical protein
MKKPAKFTKPARDDFEDKEWNLYFWLWVATLAENKNHANDRKMHKIN